MKKNKSFILAIIPARAGSKRLPNKNIMLLNGKPLIAYPIEVALKSRVFDDVIVSTDSKKIAELAKKYGANVPFMRPKKLATDKSPVADTIIYTIEKYEKIFNKKVDIIVLLQTTTPTTTKDDITKIILKLTEENYDTAITVFRVYDRPEWCGIIKNNKFKKYFSNTEIKKMSAIEWYMPGGGVYAAKRNIFFKTKSFFSDNCGYVIIPPERNTDIDTILDFRFAEYLLTKQPRIIKSHK
ncbi:MAG TPA: acylneuraminate cytidylyltransferase family protein [bacterium]|nr:acylneuraminate cytidylyltransferase family protein [bacterium]HPQ20073.1 acylneuraminate cytidylyltransferase family protein [bacterium]